MFCAPLINWLNEKEKNYDEKVLPTFFLHSSLIYMDTLQLCALY